MNRTTEKKLARAWLFFLLFVLALGAPLGLLIAGEWEIAVVMFVFVNGSVITTWAMDVL